MTCQCNSHAAHCSQPRRINSITFTLYNKRARCTAQNGTTHAPCYWAECACALWRGVRGSASALAHFCGAVNLGVCFISCWIRVWWSLPRFCAFFSHLLFTSYEKLYEHWNKRLSSKILYITRGYPLARIGCQTPASKLRLRPRPPQPLTITVAAPKTQVKKGTRNNSDRKW